MPRTFQGKLDMPRILAANQKWREENRAQCRKTGAIGQARIGLRNRVIIEAAKCKPCMDCGREYPHYVLDFDHVRGDKRRAVSKMKYCSVRLLLEEIAKCDVVCANCHRERTFKRKE